ncbi:MAG: hypothetical protein GX876_03105, partial [Bacteroidales bacterium]|nr:hypothetical protein [Bacteroidales bacterium]
DHGLSVSSICLPVPVRRLPVSGGGLPASAGNLFLSVTGAARIAAGDHKKQ